MTLRALILLLISSLGSNLLSGQIILERKVFASGGGSAFHAPNYFSFTIGEAIIGTDQTQVPFLTKGFQQPIDPLVLAPQIENPDLDGETKNGYKLYPNPAQLEVNFTYASERAGPKKVYIVNLMGQILFQQTYEEDVLAQGVQVDISRFPSGNYWLRCYDMGVRTIVPLQIE